MLSMGKMSIFNVKSDGTYAYKCDLNFQSTVDTLCIVSFILKIQHFAQILRCVIPVVLSNNKNKLMVHMYIVTNTTIFLIVRLLLLRYNYMFRPSMWAIFRLYMKHLTISYIYMWVGSLQFVGWGGCEISFCVCRRSMDRVCLGGVVNNTPKHTTRSRTHPTPRHKL